MLRNNSYFLKKATEEQW